MAEILIQDLTSGTIDGDGVFDKLMEASSIRLEQAFLKNRINATDYSNLLLQGMQGAMQQSLAYLLGVQQADVQAELTKSQKLVIDQELLNAQAQGTLLAKQSIQADVDKLNSEAELLIKTKQLDVMDSQLALNEQQTLKVIEEVKITTEGIALAIEETANKVQQNLNMAADLLQINANTDLTEQKLLNMVTEDGLLISQKSKVDGEIVINAQVALNTIQDFEKGTAEINAIEQNTANALTTNTILSSQQLKLVEEIALLNQKTVTETAQTQDIAANDSIMGKQATLYQRQADGFLRNAEQAATKMLLDTWSIRQSTDKALAGPAGINDDSIKEAVDRLKLGIGADSNSISISLPGASATAATTATGSIVTTAATGTMYSLVTTNVEELGGAVINSGTQTTVTTAGIQTILVTGLTAATTYYMHFIHQNATGVFSTVVSSTSFTTPA
jgi:hypothetical protein